MKKTFAFFLSVLLISLSVFPIGYGASQKSTYTKKIVSLVYDDSGSMFGDNWAYANYAMQAFCGMLNSEDQLYITYMSRAQHDKDYTPEKIVLSSDGIQASVDTIRAHDEDADTPFSSVDLAFRTLSGIPSEDENTQYWLVVITDGVFDEILHATDDEKKAYLNTAFTRYAGTVMPNGTRPQVTFLAIGNKVVTPDSNELGGIHNYEAESADGIIGAMAKMAHKISGRTRLKEANIGHPDSKTIEFSSTLPLLNIAVVAQKTDAKITNVSNKLSVTREVSLSYPKYQDLTGKTYLIGNQKNLIEEGTYTITFDKDVNPSDFVILLEPAIEVRLLMTANGEAQTDAAALGNLSETDRLTASYKIYKIGKNEEITPEQLPEGTTYGITLYENGESILTNTDETMQLPVHTLKNSETVIRASVNIPDFDPIASSAKFTPLPFGSSESFTIEGTYLTAERSVKIADLPTNESMGICFTVYRDGVPLTDPDLVRAANPTIAVSPQGNDGKTVFSDDGTILFYPQTASTPTAGTDAFDVEVACTIGGNKTATKNYSVISAQYEAVLAGNDSPIVKTQFFQNQKGVSFYVTKNGTKLDKNALDSEILVETNEAYRHLDTSVSVAEDGTITVTPSVARKQKYNFWTWWTNWAYYFRLPDEDLQLTLSHKLCYTDTAMEIVGERLGYLILWVYLPLLLELILLTLLIIWIVLILTKPRYLDSAKLYVGTIRYNRNDYTHTLRDFRVVHLKKFNKIKPGNGRLKFKREADVVSASGVKIRADHDGRIICTMPFQWYRGTITPEDPMLDHLTTPEQLSDYFTNHSRLSIEEFSTTETVDNALERVLRPQGHTRIKYLVVPDVGNGVTEIDDRTVIRSGLIFVYTH